MEPFTGKMLDIVVASGQTASTPIYADGHYEFSYGVMIYSPAATEAGTIEVTDGRVDTDASNVWRTLQDETGTDIAIPAAGKARLYTRIPFANGFRIKLAGAAGATRTFNTTFLAP